MRRFLVIIALIIAYSAAVAAASSLSLPDQRNQRSSLSLKGTANNGSNKISGYSIDNKFNVLAYGADPTATTETSNAVQAAWNAACNAQQSVSGGVTNIPAVVAPAGQYLGFKPLIFSCANGTISLQGAGGSATNFIQKTNTLGAAHGQIMRDLVSNYGSSIAPTTTTSLATGPGAALDFISTFWLIDLSDSLRDISSTPFNGKAQFDMRAFAKLASTQSSGAAIVCSNGSAAEQNASGLKYSLGPANEQGGAACAWVDGNLALHCAMNIGGVLKTAASANNAFTTATNHEIECSYDGSNLREFLDGTIGATTAATGSISQRVDEDMTIGGVYHHFPITGAEGLWVGQIDSVEVASVARNTTNYSMHTAKYTGDSNSIMLLLGDITEDMQGRSPAVTTPIEFGLDAYNGSTPGGTYVNAWVGVHNIALAQGNGNQFSDFGALGTVAFEGDLATNEKVTNLGLTGTYAGYMLRHESFNTHQYNLAVASSGVSSYIDVDGSGVTDSKGMQVNTCGAFCGIVVDSGGSWNHVYTAPQANTNWSFLVSNCGAGPNVYKFSDAGLDVENGGNSTGVLTVCGGTYEFDGGGITSAGTGSPFTVSSTDSHENIAIHLSNMPIGFVQPSAGGPTTIFNFLGNYPNNGSASALMTNITYVNASNNAQPGLPTGMTFTNLPSFQIERVGTEGWALPTQVKWPLPLYVVPGGDFQCPNCDPPTNPPSRCTASGLQTGSWVHVVNNQYLCTQ